MAQKNPVVPRVGRGRRPGARSRACCASDTLIVVTPKDSQVQIDLDSPEAWRTFKKSIRRLKTFINVRKWRAVWHPSKTVGHRHVTIDIGRPLSDDERILLAALLGSDLVREMINYVRLKRGAPYPVVFFRPGHLCGRGVSPGTRIAL